MPKSSPKSQDAYLYDMLEAARLIRAYTSGVTYEAFAANNEKRDAVALRLSVLGECASKIDKATEATLPAIPFKHLRGLRNRITHDYGTVDFSIVWAVVQKDIAPLISTLEAHLAGRLPG